MSKTFIKAVLAGGAISLGGIANIFTQNKIIGSLFFTIGLFLVLNYDLNLFTGKICYITDNKLNYWKDKSVSSRFYKNAINVWTVRDTNKRQTAILNNLNYKELWSMKEAIEYINFLSAS